MHKTPMEMLDHLCTGRAELNFMDVTKLMGKLTAPWDMTENPVTKFTRDNNIERQLVKAGITAQPNLCLALALSAAKSTSRFDAQIHEFKAWAAVDICQLPPFQHQQICKAHQAHNIHCQIHGLWHCQLHQ